MTMRKRKLSYPPTVRHELRQTTKAENREEVYDGYYSMDSAVLIVPCRWPIRRNVQGVSQLVCVVGQGRMIRFFE